LFDHGLARPDKHRVAHRCVASLPALVRDGENDYIDPGWPLIRSARWQQATLVLQLETAGRCN